MYMPTPIVNHMWSQVSCRLGLNEQGSKTSLSQLKSTLYNPAYTGYKPT